MTKITPHRRKGLRTAAKSLLLAACGIGIGASALPAQILLSPQRMFQYTYGSTTTEHTKKAHPLERTKDGGYLMLGTRGTFLSSKILTMRTNIQGNKIGSARTYEGQYSAGTEGADIHVTSDGGHVILGNRDVQIPVGSSVPGDIMVTKVNSTGTTSWSKRYGTYQNREQAYAIQQTSDGGYIVAGYMVDEPDDVGDVFLMKLDGNGNIQWQKAYNNFQWNYTAYAVQQADDGGFIVAGTVRKAAYDKNAFMMKVDGSGNYQWYRDFGTGSTTDIFYSVAKTGNGGFVASGALGADMYVVKVHSNGLIDWAKSYAGTAANNDIAYDIKRLVGDNYMIGGMVNNAKACMIRLKSNGDVDWSKAYAPPGTTTSAMSIVSTDRGYALGGEISSNGGDFYLVKTDGSGDGYCNTETITLAATNRTAEGNHIILHGMTDKPVQTSDDGTGTDVTMNEQQLCYIQKNFEFEEAVLTDRAYHHDFHIGIGIAEDATGTTYDPATEPVVLNGHPWRSEAIWVRRTRDQIVADRMVGAAYANEFRHEGPSFGQGTNYIYVPVENHGNKATAAATLEVYWSLSSTNLQWPGHWVRYSNEEGIAYGDRVGSVAIPSIPPGGMYIAEIPWNTPDPGDYGDRTPDVSFLARFISRTDVMAFRETANTEQNAINNNNIVWRNEIIVSADDMQPDNMEGGKIIQLHGRADGDEMTGLTFSVPQEERGPNPLMDGGSVIVDLGDELYARWEASGFQGENVEPFDGTQVRIVSEDARIDGLAISADERFAVGIRFEYDGEELPYQQYFHYDVAQEGGIGGVTFQLQFPAPGYQDLEKRAVPGNGSGAELAGVMLDARPNPAASATNIGYRLPEEMLAGISIYDINGRLVRTLVPQQRMPAGVHSVQWDGTDAGGAPVSNGIYIYRLETPAGMVNRQLRIVR